jgi:parallel beta-helix repeat protein
MTQPLFRPVALLCCAVLFAAFSPFAQGKTLCVNTGGTGGCYAKIQLAVNAAAAYDVVTVAAGTYAEGVVIGKAISLIGAGANNSFLNAAGLNNGIFIDGLDNPGLHDVTVGQFTIENAQFEGVLLLNTTGVTVRDNHIINNDQVVVSTSGASACTGQPDYETDESYDCGGGLHLLGAIDSFVSGNTVSGNSDGILISDETRETHNNIIIRNTVTANSLVCGIVLASHAPVGSQPPSYAAHFGVDNNTISTNTSTNNGALKGGAGVGLFADGEGAGRVVNNVVTGNTLTGNSLPGVALHSHRGPANGAPPDNMSGNVIVSNTISGNGSDTADSETPGTAGINISSGDGGSAVTGIVIALNNINNEDVDIGVNTDVEVNIHLNNLLGGKIGIANDCTLDGASCTGSNINARQNYWGCTTGPGGSGCSTASGTNVNTTPFMTSGAD